MDYLFAIVNIALLIVVHEFGHFVVARMCGVYTPVFSVGFGRRLWGIDLWGTDFRISAIPFGGYVRMAGADPFGYSEEDDNLPDPSMGFMQKPLWQRIAILLAGPGANVLYAVSVITVALMVGEPKELPEVGTVVPDTVAERSGFLPGDRIIDINGRSVATWGQIDALVPSLGESNTVVVERDGTQVELEVAVTEADRKAHPDGRKVPFGILNERPSSRVGVDDSHSPAGVAGIEAGWGIAKVGDTEVHDWLDVERAFRELGDAGGVELAMKRLDMEKEEVVDLSVQLVRSAWTTSDAGTSAAAAWGLRPGVLFVGTVHEQVSDAHGFLAGCRSRPHARVAPAVAGGVERGDRMLSIDGHPLHRWADVSRYVTAAFNPDTPNEPPRTIILTVRRDGALHDLELLPEVVADHDVTGRNQVRAVIGVGPVSGNRVGPTTPVYYAFPDALSISIDENVRVAKLSVERIGEVITGAAAFDQSFGGPFAMLSAGAAAAADGLFTMARLSALISLSLGVVNLVPIPVLDGGQIILFAIEAVRGRPISAAMRERVLQIAVLAMVLLMLAVTIKDIDQWLFSR